MDFKNRLLILVDVTLLIISFLVSNFLKFGIESFNINHDLITLTFGIIVFIHIVILALFKVYRTLWVNAGFFDYLNILVSFFVSFILSLLIIFYYNEIQYTVLMIFELVSFILVLGTRFVFRIYNRLVHGKPLDKKDKVKNALIFGAGQAASWVIKDIVERNLNYNIIGLIDDDISKLGNSLRGYKVIGTRENINRIVNDKMVDEVILAVPSIENDNKKELINEISNSGVKVKMVPGIYEMVESNRMSFRDVEISDLLGRSEIKLDNNEISKYITDKIVLVTGGGGSIGSELCRQIATFNPQKLIIVDIYENNAYEIQNELKSRYSYLNLEVLIASVRDEQKMLDIFINFRPHTVFHAAAHKHVPLMERSPKEAIKNNVFGTLNVGNAAIKSGVQKFILISTDKAVNPTNVMGATKRIDEMIIQMLNQESDCTFVAVRFGNVLGSNGSVIPLFKKQIENGGPVTVTHREITRFFMTISEAVSLVLQAGYYALGGEIFVLDMGEPVKIYDLAENLIRLSGYIPHIDIPIKITGLRPGEKLYEEILMDEEGLKSTPNKLIHIGQPVDFNIDEFKIQLEQLRNIAHDSSATNSDVQDCISKIVLTYIKPNN